MSVRVSERNLSEIQYLYAADQLRHYIVLQCTKLPNKFRPFILNQLVGYCYQLYEECSHADLLNLRDKSENEARILQLIKAKNTCFCIESTLLEVEKKLRQNPENFDRETKMLTAVRQQAIYKMLENVAKQLLYMHELLDVQLTVSKAYKKDNCE